MIRMPPERLPDGFDDERHRAFRKSCRPFQPKTVQQKCDWAAGLVMGAVVLYFGARAYLRDVEVLISMVFVAIVVGVTTAKSLGGVLLFLLDWAASIHWLKERERQCGHI